MATDFQTELDAFHEFVSDKLNNGSAQISLEQAVHEFRAYQRQLEQFRKDTKAALEESARGESSPLDIEDVVERGKKRLVEKGITD